MKRTWICAFLLVFCLGVGNGIHAVHAAEGLGFSISAGADPAVAQILVLDETTGAPLSAATVQLAESFESAGIRFPTDASGQVSQPAPLPKILTVSLSGYRTTSLVGATAGMITIHLKPVPASPRRVIGSGQMPTWDSKPASSVQAGLVFKAISPPDLLRFDMGTMISPLKDSIDVFGPREIPSNILLPDQRVSFGVGSIRVNKPGYRFPMEEGHPLHLAGVQVEIAAKEFMGGSADIRLLNKAKFKRIGISSSIQPKSDFVLDINASVPVTLNHQVTPSKPPFPSDLMVTSVVDLDGTRDVLLPSDVKLAVEVSKPDVVNTVQLASPAGFGKAIHLVLIAMSEDSKKISGIVHLNAGKVVKTGNFLTLTRRAFRVSNDTIKMKAPSHGVGVLQFDIKGQAQWAVYALPSAGQVEIPARQVPATGASVLQLDFGSSFKESAVDGLTQLRGLQRFTRNAIALQ